MRRHSTCQAPFSAEQRVRSTLTAATVLQKLQSWAKQAGHPLLRWTAGFHLPLRKAGVVCALHRTRDRRPHYLLPIHELKQATRHISLALHRDSVAALIS
jgi:hypothetical protein